VHQSIQNPVPNGEFLASTEVIDWYHPDVRALAWLLAAGTDDPIEITRRAFEWVRDEIQHCVDFGRTEVTCRASDVLAQKTGFCYAKSHLLAAVLRANDISAGFCYQRLSIGDGGPPYCLHGLVAVWLSDFGWYRVDPRGNKRSTASSPGILAKFDPPREYFAFAGTGAGEQTLPEIHTHPVASVVNVLRQHSTVAAVCANLPDVPLVAAL